MGENTQHALRELWESLETEITEVVDDEGVNMENGQIRPAQGGIWLYVDDVDGFQLVDGAEAKLLTRD